MAPALERIEGWGPQLQAVRESGMETGAIFYGEVERIGEIELELLHLRDYSPRKNVVSRDHPGKEP